jgi:raffinose/stachyose/melibiose transport system substrate-binding protein
MTQHNRRAGVLALASMITLGGLVLAGCSAGGDSGSTGGAVTLTMSTQTYTGKESPYQVMADKFHEANPDITVEIEQIPNEQYAQVLTTQLQAGNATDIFYTTPGAGDPKSVLNLTAGNYVLPLTGTSAENLVPESADALYYQDDQLWAQPVDIAPIGYNLNATVADEAGVTVPDTLDDFIAECQTATSAGHSMIYLAGAAAPNNGLATLSVAASTVYGPDPDWNTKRADGEVTFADTAGWKQALETILTLREDGCLQPGNEGATINEFTNAIGTGSSLGGFAPGGITADLHSAAPDYEFETYAFPAEKAADTRLFASPSNAIAINASTEHKDAALAFLDFMAQPENTAEFASLSGNAPIGDVSTETLPAAFANLEPYLSDQSKFFPLANLFWPNGEVYNALGTGVQGLLTGQTTVDAVLASMDAAWDK